jgi:hypothetical protein
VISPARRRPRWSTTVGLVLTAADVGAVLLAGVIGGWVGHGASPLPVLAAAAVAGVVARAAGAHRSRLVLSIPEDLPGLLLAAAAATGVLVLAGPAPAASGVLVLATLVLAHTLTLGTAHLARRAGLHRRRVLVVGTGPTARTLTSTLLARPEHGLLPVGMVGAGPGHPLAQARGLPLVLLGPAEVLPQLMAEAGVETVMFALSDQAGAAEAAALDGCLATEAVVYAVPTGLPDARAHIRHPRERVGGVTVVRLYRRAAPGPVRAARRVADLVATLLALSVVLPLAVLIGVLVRLETGGVLVAHPRPGEGGAPAAVPRFRTRRARSLGRPGTTWSVAISGRTGPVGWALRGTRLDRLPALVQVLVRRVSRPRTAEVGAAASATAPRSDQAKIDPRQLLA